jgi:ribose transport system substrate-binding protein
MKKIATTGLVLLGLALCFGSCGGEKTSANTVPHVGVAYCTLQEEFSVFMQKGIQEAAAKQGIQITEVDYKMDLAKGVDVVENFITMKVDAIILWPLDMTAFGGVSERAKEAGIPIITIDININENYTCYVASDNISGGRESAKYGFDFLGGKGKVLIITCDPGWTSVVERIDGYNEALKSYPNIKIVEQFDAGLEGRAGLANTVENALNANPDIDLILAGWGDCAMGALAALELYPEKFSKVQIIGYDATPDQLNAMKEGRQMLASMAQYPELIGSTAVEQAVKCAKGEPVEEIIKTAGELVTRDNVDSFGQ